jgi:OPT family oligopeptide transporter
MRVRIAGFKTSELMLGVETSPMILGAGFLIGPRIGISLGIGALLSWAVLAPWLAGAGIIENLGYRSVTGWTTWVGSSVLVSAALTSLLIRWRVVARAVRSMGKVRDHKLGSLEIGSRTWLIGLVLSAAVVSVVLNVSLGIPLWMGLLSIPISFLLAVVVVRATGETDIAPLGATGHITQIVYGGIAPGSVPANLGTAIVTAGSAGEAADLMQDLKTGYLLGATPRRQVIGQLIGVLVGTLAAVPIFFLLTRAHGLGSEKLPAIAAVVWSNFARVLSTGLSALPAYATVGVAIGVCIGILLASLEKTRIRRWMPSPVGVGIGMIFPGFQGITMALGGAVRGVVDRFHPRWSEKYAYLVAAGLIAGEGLVGIVVAILIERGVL